MMLLLPSGDECADQLDQCQGLVPSLTKPTLAALQSLSLFFPVPGGLSTL